MKYMGSKNKYAKYILPIITQERTKEQWYVEPFAGGCNTLDKVVGKRIGNDNHFYLIEMWKALLEGWLPPSEVSEELYYLIRDNKPDFEPPLVGFVGFGCSYAGKWFGGYARGNKVGGAARNYCDESKRNVLNQITRLKGVLFYNLDYKELAIPSNSIIYCDPPYSGTTKYKDDFDHDSFWEWCRRKAQDGHSVFISEYKAPEDFISLWSKTVNNTLVKNTGSKQGTEHLFVYSNTYKGVLKWTI